jgi:hypothetical protein
MINNNNKKMNFITQKLTIKQTKHNKNFIFLSINK